MQPLGLDWYSRRRGSTTSPCCRVVHGSIFSDLTQSDPTGGSRPDPSGGSTRHPTRPVDNSALLLHWLKAPEWMSYKVAVLLYQCHHGLNYDDQQTTKTFHLVNVLSRLTLSTVFPVYRRRQSVPLVCGTVLHRMSPLLHHTPAFTHVLNSISSRFLSYPNFFSHVKLSVVSYRICLFFLVFHAVTFHLGHYNRYYVTLL